MHTLVWLRMTVTRLGILLLFLLGMVYVYHVSALCSTPKVLCCVGRNDSCNQGCYCDEYCFQNKDCCSDYNSTCRKQPMKVVFDLTLSTQSRVNTEEAMGSLQNFARQVEELLRKEQCKNCSMKIIQVHQKPEDP
ncbi:uncharacterized protein LOC125801712 isoform X2 [Astyanax mexicanus]|uniref:uncharacterized protein LOC125801712 isoform X2 n=1 Tax=Astyanax mexicanus TaxID=7994 RepID=UPI0020CB61BB|nr:uncharacterized protein LOC125801712 isoform X2 [Astyanax mexicanus]